VEVKSYSIKCHYLDASALVKLVAEDAHEIQGREVLRNYYWTHTASMYATSYCIAETFSVFKRKQLQGTISGTEYIEYVKKFLHRLIGANLRVDEVSILSPQLFAEGERFFNQYGIDFIDALQIVTVLHGQFKIFAADSKTILITADKGLANAARAEGARVWECTSEPAPE
jgi:predicted nucleic acid-binding protein